MDEPTILDVADSYGIELIHPMREGRSEKQIGKKGKSNHRFLVGKMIVFTDTGFHSKNGDPENIKICPRGTWNVRMVVETVLSMLTNVCHFKKVAHRVWKYFKARLAFTMATFNLLTQWNGLLVDDNGFVPLSIADFSL
jgi:hypothetical protein